MAISFGHSVEVGETSRVAGLVYSNSATVNSSHSISTNSQLQMASTYSGCDYPLLIPTQLAHQTLID